MRPSEWTQFAGIGRVPCCAAAGRRVSNENNNTKRNTVRIRELPKTDIGELPVAKSRLRRFALLSANPLLQQQTLQAGVSITESLQDPF